MTLLQKQPSQNRKYNPQSFAFPRQGPDQKLRKRQGPLRKNVHTSRLFPSSLPHARRGGRRRRRRVPPPQGASPLRSTGTGSSAIAADVSSPISACRDGPQAPESSPPSTPLAAAFGRRRRRSGDQMAAAPPLPAIPHPGAFAAATRAPHLTVAQRRRARSCRGSSGHC